MSVNSAELNMRSDGHTLKGLEETPATPQGRVVSTFKQITVAPWADDRNSYGETRLIQAVSEHNPPLVDISKRIQFLIEVGADISALNHYGLNAFELAIYTEKYDIARLLKGDVPDELDPAKIDQLIDLAEIWTLKGRVPWIPDARASSLQLEGSGTKEKAIALLKKYVPSFFEQPDLEKELSESERNTIRKTFNDGIISPSSQMNGIYEKIQGNTPVLISHNISAFVAQPELMRNHAINVLFYKGQVAICNRGLGGPTFGVEIFQIDSSKMNDNAIRELFDEQKTNTIAEFYEKIQGFCFHDFVALEQKRQKVGNCVWVSPEASIYALLYMLLKERRPAVEEVSLRVKARTLYKECTTYMRKRSLQEYLQSPRSAPAHEIGHPADDLFPRFFRPLLHWAGRIFSWGSEQSPRSNMAVLQQIYINILSNPSRFGAEQSSMLVRLEQIGVDTHIENSLQKEITSLEEEVNQLGNEIEKRLKFKTHFEFVRRSLVSLRRTLTKLQANTSLKLDSIREKIDRVTIPLLTSYLKFNPSSLHEFLPDTLDWLGRSKDESEQVIQRCVAALGGVSQS